MRWVALALSMWALAGCAHNDSWLEEQARLSFERVDSDIAPFVASAIKADDRRSTALVELGIRYNVDLRQLEGVAGQYHDADVEFAYRAFVESLAYVLSAGGWSFNADAINCSYCESPSTVEAVRLFAELDKKLGDYVYLPQYENSIGIQIFLSFWSKYRDEVFGRGEDVYLSFRNSYNKLPDPEVFSDKNFVHALRFLSRHIKDPDVSKSHMDFMSELLDQNYVSFKDFALAADHYNQLVFRRQVVGTYMECDGPTAVFFPPVSDLEKSAELRQSYGYLSLDEDLENYSIRFCQK